MGYKVPDWKKSINQDKYDVTIGKDIYHLPKAEYLTGTQANALGEAEQSADGIYVVLDELAPGLGTAYRDIPVKYLREMLLDWQQDSGINLGELEASSR